MMPPPQPPQGYNPGGMGPDGGMGGGMGGGGGGGMVNPDQPPPQYN